MMKVTWLERPDDRPAISIGGKGEIMIRPRLKKGFAFDGSAGVPLATPRNPG